MLYGSSPTDISLGAGILFTNGKKVLLLQRAEKDNEGTWSIPGGRAEPGESPLETAKREAKEEVGEVQGKMFAHFVYRNKHQIYTTFLFSVSDKFKPELSKEHSQAEWIKINNLKKYELHSKLRKELPKYIEAINKHFKTKCNGFKEWIEYS